MTLNELQTDCASAVFSDIGLCGSPVPQACAVIDAEDHSRVITDAMCRHFTRYYQRHRPKSRRDMARADRKVKRRVEADLKTGFAPILVILGQAFVSWLLGRAFSWLWNYFTLKGPETATQLAGSLPSWGIDPSDEGE